MDTFIKKYAVERKNKGEIRPKKQSEKAEEDATATRVPSRVQILPVSRVSTLPVSRVFTLPVSRVSTLPVRVLVSVHLLWYNEKYN